jgi:hypothetical protein
VREDGAPIITDEDLEKTRREGRDEEWIQQEYFCAFTGAVEGSYFSRDINLAYQQGRVGRVPADPGRLCVTAWDWGIKDQTAIWVLQPLGKEIRALAYLEDNNQALAHWAGEVKALRYGYDEHLLPHDFAHRESTGRTRHEVLEELGIRPARVMEKTNIADQIQALRATLPRMYFNEATCERGLAALVAYSREWDEDAKVFKPKPRHDWASHGTSALMTFALGWREPAIDAPRTRAEMTFNPYEDDAGLFATADTAPAFEWGR